VIDLSSVRPAAVEIVLVTLYDFPEVPPDSQTVEVVRVFVVVPMTSPVSATKVLVTIVSAPK